jgi:DNA repair exonuclease SbcCD ATPase subunit
VDLDEAAEELYAVAPEDFLATRSALVARAREDGDKALAAAVGKLRKPSTAAWLVNLLAYEAADDLSALLDLGAAMRHAQARLSGAELRKLTQQRHQVVRALATQAHHLATERGERPSRSVLDQVMDTLLAALADPEQGELVRAGHLTNPLSYSGFGPAGLAAVPSPPEETEDADDEAEEEPDEAAEAERAEAERQRRLEQARTEQARAQGVLEAARRKVTRAERTVETSGHELERADDRLAQAEETLARARADQERLAAAAREAERTLAGQRAAEQEAAQELERATAAVAELEDPS